MGALIDSDVVIDYLRAVSEAESFIEGLEGRICLSAITVAELYQGVREGRERKQLEVFFQCFQILPISKEIAEMGGLYRRDFRKSHRIGLADALIAATATVFDLTLHTLNTKHYPMIEGIQPPYIK